MLRSLSLLVELKSVLTPLTEVLTNLLVVRRLLARAKAGAQTVTLLTQRMAWQPRGTNAKDSFPQDQDTRRHPNKDDSRSSLDDFSGDSHLHRSLKSRQQSDRMSLEEERYSSAKYRTPLQETHSTSRNRAQPPARECSPSGV
ncbi:hypothetical protein YC2023_121503 [Brassica napus]